MLPPRSLHLSPLRARAIAIAGIFLVGYLDYLTGIEIRIFPLYFLPLMLAAWYTSKREAFLLSLFSTPIWTAALYYGGKTYSHPAIWVINCLTQSSAFILVTALVSSLKTALDREYQLSHTDPLTKLPNSRFFYEEALILLDLCRRHGMPITLAYVDLDNFKGVNDTFGHLYGDELLQEVANLFRNNFRSSDVIARMGGDEFVILLPDTTRQAAQILLQKFSDLIVHIPQFQTTFVTVSIGAVAYPIAPSHLDQMIHSADQLMYQVKRNGKNHVVIQNR